MNHRRALLLDFDGVVLRNHKIHRYVGNVCTRVLSQKAKLDYATAKDVNSRWYPIYGHSSFIIDKKYGIPCSVKEFNDLVYEKYMDFDLVQQMLSPQDIVYAHQFADVIDTCAPDTTFLFSNANDRWCANLMSMLGIQGAIPTSRYLCSDNLEALKPSNKSYSNAENHVRRAFPDVTQFVGVDDQAKNVRGMCKRRDWIGIYYTPSWTPNDLKEILTI